MNDQAAVNIRGVVHLMVGLIVAVLGLFIFFTLLASLINPFAGSVKNVSANFTTADWGNATANSLGSTFGLIISLVGMFSIIALVIGAAVYFFRHDVKGGL